MGANSTSELEIVTFGTGLAVSEAVLPDGTRIYLRREPKQASPWKACIRIADLPEGATDLEPIMKVSGFLISSSGDMLYLERADIIDALAECSRAYGRVLEWL